MTRRSRGINHHQNGDRRVHVVKLEIYSVGETQLRVKRMTEIRSILLCNIFVMQVEFRVSSHKNKNQKVTKHFLRLTKQTERSLFIFIISFCLNLPSLWNFQYSVQGWNAPFFPKKALATTFQVSRERDKNWKRLASCRTGYRTRAKVTLTVPCQVISQHIYYTRT